MKNIVFKEPFRPRGQDEDILRVSNGFVRNYGRNGYRDVKVIALVAEHACEIQLHLRSFYGLKAGQHEVYEWSRTLKVTAEIQADHLIRGLQSDVLELMIQLAAVDWKSTGVALAPLLYTAGRYAEAQDLQSQVSTNHQENRVKGYRMPLLRRRTAVHTLSLTFASPTCADRRKL